MVLGLLFKKWNYGFDGYIQNEKKSLKRHWKKDNKKQAKFFSLK